MTISVVTATYRDWPALRRAIASLNAQTYGDWQHVIVADGPDTELRKRLGQLGYGRAGRRVFVELGRNWHAFLGGDGQAQDPSMPGARGGRGSRGVTAYNTGTVLAAGEWIGYLDQDVEFTPDHLQRHAAALATSGSDFTFSRMRRYLDGQFWDEVGNSIPTYGCIDGNVVIHRAELLKAATWRRGGDADFDLIGRWTAGGATHTYVPYVTVNWHHAAADI